LVLKKSIPQGGYHCFPSVWSAASSPADHGQLLAAPLF